MTLVEEIAADMAEIDPAIPIAHALPQGMVFDLPPNDMSATGRSPNSTSTS